MVVGDAGNEATRWRRDAEGEWERVLRGCGGSQGDDDLAEVRRGSRTGRRGPRRRREPGWPGEGQRGWTGRWGEL